MDIPGADGPRPSSPAHTPVPGTASAAPATAATPSAPAATPSALSRVRRQLFNVMAPAPEHVAYLRYFLDHAFSHAMKVVGPALIMVASDLISGVLWYGVRNIVPLYGPPGSMAWCVHTTVAVFLAFNIMFNYAACVVTNAGSTGCPTYRKLVSEARATGNLPQLAEDDVAFLSGGGGGSGGGDGGLAAHAASGGASNNFGLDAEIRKRAAAEPSPTSRRHARVGSGGGGGGGGWIDRGPYEWAYCERTQAPKAPRAHYDHVTKKQVLNMDHYCPWMFNPVGYLNYRYFWLFLLWVWAGCVYCVFMTMIPFASMTRRRPVWGVSVQREARGSVSFIFIITSSVGFAVSILFFWHVYLLLTAQTTIEFYGNRTRAARSRSRGEIFRNPYDLGTWRNWCQVMGDGNPLVAVLPSLRRPPWPPWPSLKRNAVDQRRAYARHTV